MIGAKKRKLMLVRPTLGRGGADRVTLTLMRHIDRDDFDISLVLMRSEGEFISDIPKDINVIITESSNLMTFLLPLKAAIRKELPDIVFSTCGGANMPLAISAFLSPFRRNKIILSERNVVFPPGKGFVKRSIMLFLKIIFYRFTDVYTAVSEGVKSDMCKWLMIPDKKIRVVYNPIVDEFLLNAAQEKVDHPWFTEQENIPVILHVGRFVHQKDHVTLLKSFVKVRESIDARLVLLGDGPLKSKIETLANSLNLTKHIDFLGFDKNPFKYMGNCDIFVLSSIHEGMPGVLIQAMACGAPSVSSDCPFGPNEIISIPGENGMLVPVGDSGRLASTILKVLGSDSLRSEMAKKGKSAVEQFGVDRALKTYLAAMDS